MQKSNMIFTSLVFISNLTLRSFDDFHISKLSDFSLGAKNSPSLVTPTYVGAFSNDPTPRISSGIFDKLWGTRSAPPHKIQGVSHLPNHMSNRQT